MGVKDTGGWLALGILVSFLLAAGLALLAGIEWMMTT